MLEAFGWGALGASALLVGALIGSVSFELVNEALKTQTVAWVGLSVLVGAATFTVGDWLLERRGGGERKDPTGAQAELQRPPRARLRQYMFFCRYAHLRMASAWTWRALGWRCLAAVY